MTTRTTPLSPARLGVVLGATLLAFAAATSQGGSAQQQEPGEGWRPWPLGGLTARVQPTRETCRAGTLLFQGMACSSAVASCSTTCSCAGGAAICTPMGMPLECMASGSEMAGVPMMLCGIVN